MHPYSPAIYTHTLMPTQPPLLARLFTLTCSHNPHHNSQPDISHLTSLNDNEPSKEPRNTGTSNKYQTYQPIRSRDTNTPPVRHPGTSKDNLTLQSDIMSDSRLPNSLHDVMSQPGRTHDSSLPKTSSQPQMTPTLLTFSTSSPEPPPASLHLMPQTPAPQALAP